MPDAMNDDQHTAIASAGHHRTDLKLNAAVISKRMTAVVSQQNAITMQPVHFEFREDKLNKEQPTVEFMIPGISKPAVKT